MFRKLFGTSNSKAEAAAVVSSKSSANTMSALDRMNETKNMLDKRDALLQKKIGDELEKAKEYTRLKNKRSALMCLKRKKMYEQQSEAIQNNILRITEQTIMLEGAKSTMETVGAMKQSAQVMKNMQKETNIDDVDKTLEEINDVTDQFKQMQEALGEPVGGVDFDDDELDKELEEIEAEELDKQLLEPAIPPTKAAVKPAAAAALPAMPAAPTKTPARPMTEEERELAALEREMALE